MVGDMFQVCSIVMTSKDTNPTHRILEQVLMARSMTLNVKAYELWMQCRVRAGQAALLAECFYDPKIEYGPCTELTIKPVIQALRHVE